MMNTGTNTMRRMVSWFAVVARDSARRGLRRRLIDIYGNLDVKHLERTKAIGLVAEEVFQFAGDFIFAGLACAHWKFDARKYDVVLILCFRIVPRRRKVRFGESDASNRCELEREGQSAIDGISLQDGERDVYFAAGARFYRRGGFEIRMENLRQCASRTAELADDRHQC